VVLLSDEFGDAVVSELGLAEGHVAAADLAVHELQGQVLQEVEEEDVVPALGLLPEHLLGQRLVDALHRLGPAAGTGEPAALQDPEEVQGFLLADHLLVWVGLEPVGSSKGG
jgi:hypothetical protein